MLKTMFRWTWRSVLLAFIVAAAGAVLVHGPYRVLGNHDPMSRHSCKAGWKSCA